MFGGTVELGGKVVGELDCSQGAIVALRRSSTGSLIFGDDDNVITVAEVE